MNWIQQLFHKHEWSDQEPYCDPLFDGWLRRQKFYKRHCLKCGQIQVWDRIYGWVKV